MIYFLPQDTGLIIAPDLVLSENHVNVAEITEHPVEVGANLADHIRTTVLHFSCEVFVTNSPIKPNGPRPSSNEADTSLVMVPPWRGAVEKIELEIPTYEPPLEPTPGSAFRLAGKAIGAVVDLITGGPPTLKADLLIFPEVFNRVKEFQEILVDMQNRGIVFQVITDTTIYNSMALSSITLPITESGGSPFTLEFTQIRTVSSATVQAPKPKEPRGAPPASKGGQSPDPTNDPKKIAKSILAQVLGS